MAHTITIYTRVLLPWEEDQDEPECKSEDSEEFTVADWQDDHGDWNEDETEWIPATIGETAVAMLKGAHTHFYALESSASGPGVDGSCNPWYTSEPYTDPHSGEIEEKSAHLKGFTAEETRAIFSQLGMK